jgi:hypothetical protein
VVDFPDDVNNANKYAFLNKYVFDTQDFLADVKKQPNKAFRERDANKTSFVVDRKHEYPDISLNEMLNKDFAVAYDDETEQVSFWAIEGSTRGQSNANVLEYVAVRD